MVSPWPAFSWQPSVRPQFFLCHTLFVIIHLFSCCCLFCSGFFFQAVRDLMSRPCRCHGVSGSCAVKTCWHAVPSISEVGAFLKRKHAEAVYATSLRKKRKHKHSKFKVPRGSLVHVDLSPNYCYENDDLGVLGTTGRFCNKTSSGPDRCDRLCCGRGYNTQVVREDEQCNCEFVWCCEVKCQRCRRVYDKYTCKWFRPVTCPVIVLSANRWPAQVDLRSWTPRHPQAPGCDRPPVTR